MAEKSRFDVSLRMTVFFGPGSVPREAEHLHPIRLAFALGGGQALVAIGTDLPADREADIVFLVDPAGCREILGDTPDGDGLWHLDSAQRSVAHGLLTCDVPEPAGRSLRTLRAVELLWTVISELRADRLVPADGGCVLGELDTRRIVAARKLIDERWRERLTIDSVARDCGVNRVKLTRGFRAMFATSVAEAIAERRLCGARQMLLTTDLPVSSIGYACGYTNNASFARAFLRRFGTPPSQLRTLKAAA